MQRAEEIPGRYAYRDLPDLLSPERGLRHQHEDEQQHADERREADARPHDAANPPAARHQNACPIAKVSVRRLKNPSGRLGLYDDGHGPSAWTGGIALFDASVSPNPVTGSVLPGLTQYSGAVEYPTAPAGSA